MSSSRIFCAGIPAFVLTPAECVDLACFSIRCFRRASACCNRKAGQWLCHTCPDLSLIAVLSVRSSACILKHMSSTSAASPSVLHAPRMAALNSRSPDDREITAFVVVPAKIGCLPAPSVRNDLPCHKACCPVHIAESSDLGRHGLPRIAPQQPRRCEVVPS